MKEYTQAELDEFERQISAQLQEEAVRLNQQLFKASFSWEPPTLWERLKNPQERRYILTAPIWWPLGLLGFGAQVVAWAVYMTARKVRGDQTTPLRDWLDGNA